MATYWCGGGWCSGGWGGGSLIIIYEDFVTASLKKPTLKFSANAVIHKVVVASLKKPALKFSATALVDKLAVISLKKPSLKFSATAFISKQVIIGLKKPILKFSANAVINKVSMISLKKPTLQMRGYAKIIPVAYSYSGICMNTRTGSHTEYDNFAFNSFCYYNGKYYGANDNGIFLLEGLDDNGVDINAYFLTGDIDSWKASGNMPSVIKNDFELWLSHQTSEEVVVEVTGDYDGAYLYSVQSDGRVKIGRGFKSRFYNFKFQNKLGSAFTVENMRLKAGRTTKVR